MLKGKKPYIISGEFSGYATFLQGEGHRVKSCSAYQCKNGEFWYIRDSLFLLILDFYISTVYQVGSFLLLILLRQCVKAYRLDAKLFHIGLGV